MSELLYKELSYKIVGLAYEIDNLIGYGQSEKIFCDCFEKLLIRDKIKYERELYYPIKINGELIAKKYFDFLIDDKIVVEFKIGDFLYKQACTQLFSYLKASDHKLGLIIRFTKNGVKIKRIPNIRD